MQVQHDGMEVTSRVKAERQACFPCSKICKAEGEHRTLADALEAAEAQNHDNIVSELEHWALQKSQALEFRQD